MGSINQPIEDPLYTLEYIEDPLYIYIYILSYVLSCFLKSFYVVKPVEFRIVFMFDINGRSSYGSHWHPMDNLKEPNYCWFLGRYPAW